MARFLICVLQASLLCSCYPDAGGARSRNSDVVSEKEPPITVGDSMFASPEEEHLKKELFYSQQLSITLEGLEGVRAARVHLNLADSSFLSKKPRETSTASILIQHTPSFRKDVGALQAFVSNATEGLSPDHVQLLFAEAPEEPVDQLVRLGPIVVTESTAWSARLCIGGLLLLCLLLALCLIVVGLKLRKTGAGRVVSEP